MPIQLFDPTSGAPLSNVDNASSAIQQGTAGVDRNAQYSLIDSQGKSWTFPGSSVPDALSKGFKLPDDHQAALQASKDEGLLGAAKVGLNRVANGATLGIVDVLQNKLDTPEQKLQREAAEEAHGVAASVGEVAGFGAGLVSGAPLFKAAGTVGEAAQKFIAPEVASEVAGKAAVEEGASQLAEKLASSGAEKAAPIAAKGTVKDALRGIAGSAAKFGIDGVTFAAPQASAQVAVGDPDEAAESLLWGLGAGAALGGIGRGLKEAGAAALNGVSELASKLNVGERADKMADNLAFKSTGLRQSNIRRLGEKRAGDLADIIQDEVITKPWMNKEEIAERIAEIKKGSGESIGNFYKQFDQVLHDDPELMVHTVDAGKLQEKLIDQLGPLVQGPLYSTEAHTLDNIVGQVAEYGDGPISFQKAFDLKTDLNKYKLPSNPDLMTPKDQLIAKARTIIKNTISEQADALAEESGNTELYAKWKKDNRLYAAAKDLEKGSLNNFSAEMGNRHFGLTDFIHAGSVAPVGRTLGAIGSIAGPVGYAAGRAASFIPDILIKHWVEDKGTAAAAYYLKKFASSPDFPAILVKDAANRVGGVMNQIPTFLKQGAVQLSTQPDVYKSFLGSDANGLSKSQQQAKVAQTIQDSIANPNVLADHASHVTHLVGQANTQVADAYTSALTRNFGYLNSLIPPSPPPSAFSYHPPSKTDPAQWKKFNDALAIQQNPMSIWDKISKGTATSSDMQHLQTLYPKIHQQMINKISEMAADTKAPKLSLKVRQQLSLLTGAPLDASQVNLSVLQGSYSTSPSQPSPRPSPDGFKGMPSFQTSTDSLLTKS